MSERVMVTGGITPKRYKCAVHGDQGGIIGVEITLTTGPGYTLPTSLLTRANRRYCMACWVDMMDREMEPLEEIQ